MIPDCYPGDSAYTEIVQQIYRGVTSDSILLTGPDQPKSRYQLCSTLTNHHNSGKNPGQMETNSEFLGQVTVTQTACAHALIYTQGYNDISGWQQWAGYHSGNWYSSENSRSDTALWSNPSYKPGNVYVLQPVRFDSQYRIENCITRDSTGSTCRHGWFQSGQNVNSLYHRAPTIMEVLLFR